MEDEEDCRDQADPRGGVIPAQMLAEVEEGEDGEDDERNDLLNHLELDGRKAVGADAVGRHLEAVFEESDAPADQDDLPQRFLAEFQVAVPSEGHEDVGAGQEQNRSHVSNVALALILLPASDFISGDFIGGRFSRRRR